MRRKFGLLVIMLCVIIMGCYAQNKLNEDFEGTVFPPDNWTVIGADYEGMTWELGDWFIINGSYSAYMEYEEGFVGGLVTPLLYIDNGDRLIFTWKIEGYYNEYNTSYVAVTENSYTSISDFSIIKNITTADFQNGDTQSFMIDLSQYEGKNIYIMFYNMSNNGGMVALDDVKIVDGSCLSPQYLQVTNVAFNGATISWNAENDSDEWYLQYKKSNQQWEDIEDTLHIISVPYSDLTQENLSVSTYYDVRVAKVCEVGHSDWVETSFKTMCYTTVVTDDEPFVESFNTPNVLNCWIYDSDSEFNNKWEVYEGQLFHNWTTGSDAIISPIFDLTQLTNPYLKFSHRQASSGVGLFDRLSIFYRTETTQDWVLLVAYDDAIESMKSDSIHLEQVGEKYQLKFVFQGSNAMGVYVDDLSIYNIEQVFSCLSAENLVVTDSTTSSVTLDWNQSDNASSWQIFYKTKDYSSSWLSTSVITDKPYTLTGLKPSTAYDWYVVSLCGQSNNPKSAVSYFVTACDYLTVEQLPLYWDFEENNLAGSTTAPLPLCWSRTNESTPSVQATNLMNGKRALCNNNYLGDSYAVLPSFASNVNMKDLQITFTAKYGGTENKIIEVGVMTDPNNPSTFSKIQSVVVNNIAKDYTVSFAAYDGVGKTIAIHFLVNGTDYYSYYLDDVIIEKSFDCEKSSDSYVTEITDTYVTIAVNGEQDGDYSLYYRQQGTSSWQGPYVDENMSILLIGLKPATTYQYYIETACDDDIQMSKVLTFHTLCSSVGITEFPWSEGFEDEWQINDLLGTNKAPNCWTVYDGGYSGIVGLSMPFKWDKNTSMTQVHSGESSAVCLTIDADGSHNDWLITPLLVLDGNKQVSFYVQNNNETTNKTDEISVWISNENVELSVPSDDTQPLDGFTEIFQHSIPKGGFTKYVVSLEGYSGNRYLAFVRRNTPNDGWALCLDDVTVEELSSCVAVNHANVYFNDATALLSIDGKEDVQYKIYYRKTTEEEWSESGVATDLVASLDIEYDTQYDYYIQTICEGEDNVSSKIFQFTTPCQAIAESELPFTDGFEDYAKFTKTPNCWTIIGGNPSVYTNESYFTYANSGGKCLYSSGNMTAILPVIATDLENLTLKLAVRPSQLQSTVGKIQIGVTTDMFEASDFELVFEKEAKNWAGGLSPVYEELNIYFAGVEINNNVNQYIVIRLDGVADYANWCIDDVEVNIAPDCATPSSIKAKNITQNSATISWSQAGITNTWRVAYRKNGTKTWTYSAYLSEKSYDLTNLEPGAKYDVQVRSICNGVEMYNDPILIVTECTALTEETLPYTMNFDSEESIAGNIPTCWSRVNTTNTDYPYIYNFYANSSPNTLMFYNIGNAVALPAYSGDISKVQLVFSARPNGTTQNNGSLSIGLMTNLTDMDSYIEVKKYSATEWQVAEYIEKAVEFSNISVPLATNEDVYVVIKRVGGTDNMWFVDDISLELIPECKKVYESSAQTTTTTAAITIEGNEDGLYNVYYRLRGSNTWGEAVAFEGKNVVIDNLISSSIYEYYIETVCGAEDNVASSVFSFATECDKQQLPYIDGFETYYQNKQPLCWTIIASDPSYPYIANGIYFSHSGVQALYSFNDLTFALPLMDSLNKLYINLYARPISNTANMGKLQIGIASDLINASDFQLIYEKAATQWSGPATAYEEIETDFKDMIVKANQYQYIVIRILNSSNAAWYIDDIMVDFMPSCKKIKETQVVTTEYTATVSLMDTEEDTQYNVYYRVEGEESWSDPISVADNMAVIQNLLSATSYEYYVETICPEDSSNPVSSIFQCFTKCLPVTVSDSQPWMPVFKENSDVQCWNLGSNIWTVNLDGLYHNSYMPDDNPDAVSPILNIEDVTNPWLSFSYSLTDPYNMGYNNYLTVLYRHDDSDWVELASYTESTDYAQVTMSLPNPSDNYQLMFRWSNFSYFAGGIQITNLKIYNNEYLPAPCKAPKNLSADSIAMDMIAVSWTGNTDKYNIQLDNQTPVETDSNGYTFYGLTQKTTYKIKVQGICEDSTLTSWSKVLEVTTEAEPAPPCNEPVDVVIKAVTYDAATIGWNSDISSYYEIQLDEQEIQTVSSNTITFSGLTENTSYVFKVRSVCDTNSYSDWVAIEFTTAIAPSDDCPKPTNLELTSVSQNSATISWTGTVSAYEVKLLDQVDQPSATTTFTFQNLTPNTHYTAQVRSLCAAEEFSEWVSIEFTTYSDMPIECLKPTDLTIADTTQTTATITWNGDATLYNVQLNENAIINTAEKTYTFENLTANTEYTAKVRSNCSDGVSDWVSIIFTTSANSLIDIADNVVMLTFPNPTTNDATLQLQGLKENAEVVLTDVRGRVLLTEVYVVGQKSMTIYTHNLSSGVYYVRVMNDTLNITQQLIKQ